MPKGNEGFQVADIPRLDDYVIIVTGGMQPTYPLGSLGSGVLTMTRQFWHRLRDDRPTCSPGRESLHCESFPGPGEPSHHTNAKIPRQSGSALLEAGFEGPPKHQEYRVGVHAEGVTSGYTHQQRRGITLGFETERGTRD
jgi:hypothetical protein